MDRNYLSTPYNSEDDRVKLAGQDYRDKVEEVIMKITFYG